MVNVQIPLWISVLDEVLLTIMIGRLPLTHVHGCESHIALLIELGCLQGCKLALALLARSVAPTQLWIVI